MVMEILLDVGYIISGGLGAISESGRGLFSAIPLFVNRETCLFVSQFD